MVTATCDMRRPVFGREQEARIAMDEFDAQAREGNCVNLAYVVMPDHVHWIFQLTSNGRLSGVVAKAKGRSAHRINRLKNRRGRIWQPGFHDHAVRQEEDLENLANYVIHNPVRAGLVVEPGDYRYWWSAWHPRHRA